MGVKAGYKQTEVGVIPEDWDTVEYVAFGQVIDGDRGVHYPSVSDLRESGHTLFLNAGNVTKTGFRFAACQFISADKDAKLNKGHLTRGDVVLTTRGTLGNFAYFDDDVPYEHIRINSGMVILRNTSRSVSNAYQYLVLRSRVVASQIERLSFGSAQPQLTVKGISTLKIPLPSAKSEQEAIADALSDADDLIESLEQLLAKKRHLKQGAMQQLLTGKVCLPGFSGEWEAKKVCELGNVVTGGTPSTQWPTYWGEEFPWVTPTDISGQKDIHSTERQLTSEGLAALRALPTNSVLVTCIASIGKNAILRRPGACNQQINAVVPTAANDVDFLYYLFEASKRYLLANAGITATLIISKRAFSELSFCVPSADEQSAIAAVLSDMDAEIAALDAKLSKARSLKQGMMQELLTGRIRLV